jgi:hypothetical protein
MCPCASMSKQCATNDSIFPCKHSCAPQLVACVKQRLRRPLPRLPVLLGLLLLFSARCSNVLKTAILQQTYIPLFLCLLHR